MATPTTRTLPLVVPLAILLGLLAAGPARAQESGGDDGGAAAIVSPTTNALVAIRRSEPRSEVALSVGAAVVAQSSRGGLQRGAVELSGSWAPSRRWELFATFNVTALRSLTIDGQSVNHVRVGAMTLGPTWVPISLPGGRLDGGFFLRVLLPTSGEIDGVHGWGVQPGLTFRGLATGWLAWFGGFSYRVGQTWGTLTTPVTSMDASSTQTGVSAMAGAALVPSSWLRVVAQCTGNAPITRGASTLTPGVGVRFVDGPFTAELAAGIGLGGSTRAFSSMARVSWRFGS
jgi:hypothetical protein